MSPLTQDGIVFGTPEYMSPEQAKGEPLSTASDVYTLGVCCYEMLSGHLPFGGKTFTEILSKHVTQAPVPPSERFPGLVIDPRLETLIMRCMSKDQRERPSALEFAQELRGQPAPVAPTVASSETLIVSEASMASLQTPTYSASHETTRRGVFSSKRKSPRGAGIAAFAAIAVAMAAFVILRGDAPSSGDAVVTTAGPAGLQSDASLPIMKASIASPDHARATLPAALVDAGASLTTIGQPNPGKRVSKPIPDLHLEAAEHAYRSGNVLKQLSEANASLKRNRRGRRAAFLVGDALQKSGDKVAACKFLRRAGTKHYRAAGCSD